MNFYFVTSQFDQQKYDNDAQNFLSIIIITIIIIRKINDIAVEVVTM